METLIVFVISVVLGVLLMKGSIRLVDGYNHKNSWAAAFGWTFFFSLVGLVPIPFIFGILILMAYFMVLTRYYEIGVLRSVGVLLAQILGAVGIGLVYGTVTGTLGAV